MKRTVLSTAAVAAVSIACMGATWVLPGKGQHGSSTALTTDLVSYWDMDETGTNTREDSTATNNDLDTAVAAPTHTSSGKISNAMHLDNDTDAMRRASPSNLGIPSSGVLTVAGWVQPKGSVADGDICGLRTSYPSNIQWIVATVGTNSRYRVYLRAGSNDYEALSASSSAAVDTWAFLICEFDDSAKEIRISVNNGTPVTTSYSGSPASVTPAFQFGKPGSGGETGAVCYADEWGVWDRTLTSDEKAALYNSGNGTTYPF